MTTPAGVVERTGWSVSGGSTSIVHLGSSIVHLSASIVHLSASIVHLGSGDGASSSAVAGTRTT